MPPKKRAKALTKATLNAFKEAEGSAMTPFALWGTSEDPSNASKGLMSLPTELVSKVLATFEAVDAFTDIQKKEDVDKNGKPTPHVHLGPLLPAQYLERSDALRALSQTCVVYRRRFAPLLWERLESCVTSRAGTTPRNFYIHVSTTLLRKSIGLTKNKDIAEMVGIVNVCLTQYQTASTLPAFVECLKNLPNLHTIHVLHAHAEMTTPIRLAFEGASLPSVRTVIIPGNCHELLKCCPEVRSVTSLTEGGSKLVGIMQQNCKKVEELRGFSNLIWYHNTMIKRLVKAAPNLRTLELEVETRLSDAMCASLKTLENLCVFEILVNDAKPSLDLKEEKLQALIKTLRNLLASSPSKEKKYLWVLHQQEQTGHEHHVTRTDVGLI